MSKKSELSLRKADLVPLRGDEIAESTLFVDIEDAVSDADSAPPIDLRQIWSMILRHKGVILLVALLIFTINLILTLRITPTYRATVMIKASPNTSRVLEYDVDAGGSYYADYTFFQTQLQMLTSRPLIRRTIDELGLEKSLKPPKVDDNGSSILGDIKESIKSTLRGSGDKSIKLGEVPVENQILGKLNVESTNDSQIIKMHIVDQDPSLAATIANSLAENYIKMNLESRVESASYAKDFLSEQLALAKSRLKESEQKLVDYEKRESIIRTTQDDKAPTLTSSSIDAINKALADAELARIQAENKLENAEAKSGLVSLDNKIIEDLKRKRLEIQNKYQEELQVYKPGYPTMVQMKSQIRELSKRIKQEEEHVKTTYTRDLEADYLAAKSNEKTLRAELEKQKEGLLAMREKTISYNTLQREVETNRNLYEGLLQRLKEVTVAANIGTNNISIVEPAVVPYKQYKPNTRQRLLIGLLIGILLGALVAYLLELIDDRIRSIDEMERILKLPVLGVTPREKGKDPIKHSLMTHQQPTSAMAEAFRSLRTNLLFATREGVPKSLSITSASASEGKTSACVNTATAFAQSGKRVLLVDADLRKPSLHKRLKLDNSHGLTNFLTHQNEIEEIVQETEIPNVYAITAGPTSPNPAELLSSGKLGEITNLSQEDYDLVIIDSPPVLGLADALLISNVVNATIMISAFGESRKRTILDALKRLKRTKANLIGVVLTKIKTGASYGYHYHYDYYYSYGPDRLEKKSALDT